MRENGSVRDILSTRLPVLLLPPGLTYRGVSNGEKRNSRFHGYERASERGTKPLRKRNYLEMESKRCLDAAWTRETSVNGCDVLQFIAEFVKVFLGGMTGKTRRTYSTRFIVDSADGARRIIKKISSPSLSVKYWKPKI